MALLILGGLGIGARTEAATPAALARVPEALPGAALFPAAVRHALAEELASRPAAWEPRTRHRHADGSPRFTNRLALETSPYLRQHAHNPVDWHPWGPEAFARAKERGQLVFVSIGYSTCHWCHVMEEESFDDVDVARELNAGFVAIKVDREVRPDVDAVYMTAAQLMNGQGGWPLNVFVTAEGEPFFAGTYFPREDRAGRPGILRVLAAVRSEFAANPERLAQAGATISAQVRRALVADVPLATWLPTPRLLHLAARQAVERADRTFGGIGERQKFPSSTPIRFLLRYHRRTGDPKALEVATQTLDRMARGGIRDHLGGGFHRYATDRRWLVPHFEKMLYDNARLALAYLEGWQATGRQDFAAVTREILAYVEAEMTSPEGVFYSATDADSPGPDGEPEEGLFFTWTPTEIDAVLGGTLGRIARAWYGVEEGGHVEGRSVLHTGSPADEVAARFEIPPEAFPAMVEEARAALLAARARRSPPLRDDKVIVAWNALMISALARAGFALAEPDYVARAARAAAFLLDRVRSEGRLHRVWIGGRAEGTAFLEDYAFLIAALLDLYEADSDPRWMREALALQSVLDSHYADAGQGYFRTADDAPALLVREKPGEDGALPSGNSVALSNALRLHAFTLARVHEDRALGILASFQDRLQNRPLAFGEMLLALDYQLDAAKEIVVVTGPSGSADAHLAVIRSRFAPNRVIAVVTEEAARAQQAMLPLLRGRVAPRGVTTVYVCEDGICQLPITEPEHLRDQLAAIARLD